MAKKTPSRKTAVTKKAAAKPAPAKKAKPAKSAKAAKPTTTARKPAPKPAARKTSSIKQSAKVRSKPAVKASKATKPTAAVKPIAAVTGTVKLKRCPLSRKELAEFRQMLLDKRRVLVGDMNGMEAEAFRANRQDGGDLSTMPVHMADIGTDNYEQEFTLGLLESERQLLREINEAIDRIEKGIYGICLGTGEAIATARLRAKPWAKYCIDYARKLEQGLVRLPSMSYAAPADDDDDDDDDDDLIIEDEEEVDIDDELAAHEAEEDLSL